MSPTEFLQQFPRSHRGRAGTRRAAVRTKPGAEAAVEPADRLEIDLDDHRPDPTQLHRLAPRYCLTHRLIPWRRLGARTIIAAADPEAARSELANLERIFGPVTLAPANADAIHRHIERAAGAALAVDAENRAPDSMSARLWSHGATRAVAAAIFLLAGAGFSFAHEATMTIITLIIMLGIAPLTMIRIAGLFVRAPAPAEQVAARLSDRELPIISVLVPLLREREITGHLLRRLSAIDYPQDKLHILLIVEDADAVTKLTLGSSELEDNMRVVVVPAGHIQTKPRAMNYALDFVRGSILGIYDAEDAPDPGQLRAVAERFAQVDDNVACLQGQLDYYNDDHNLIARCFTLEYAGWFRVVLPALQALRFPIPLGGTTLFFRRRILDQLGGWDAHNVTEDADLGVRLWRAGFRTEILRTVTAEEANCRPWPWVKQRTRWLKGYIKTYFVHMRAPGRLLRDLGPRGFAGFQFLFGGTLLLIAISPVFWFLWWQLALGFAPAQWDTIWGIHPGLAWSLIGLFVASELAVFLTYAKGASLAGKRWLWKWIPLTHFYHPFASVALYRAVWELAFAPHYWDKTAHGHSTAGDTPSDAPAGSVQSGSRSASSLSRVT